MALRIKTLLLVVLLLLIPLSSGIVEGFKDGMHPSYSLYKGSVQMNLRKLLMVDDVLDYDDAGANPKHDPNPKKKPGVGSGKNP